MKFVTFLELEILIGHKRRCESYLFHLIFNAVQSLELVVNQETINLKIPTSILDSLHSKRSNSGTFILVDVQVSVQADSADRRLTIIVDHSRLLPHSVDSCCVCIYLSEFEKLFNSFYLYSFVSFEFLAVLAFNGVFFFFSD